MIRGLALITVIAAGVSMLGFGAASMRGPLDFHSDGVSDSMSETRNLPWAGGTQLSFNVAGEILIVQGTTPGIIANGPKDLVDRLTLVDNSIELPGHTTHWSFGRHPMGLRLIVTTPDLDHVTMNGFGSLELRDYQKKSLQIELNGAGSIKGSGKVDGLKLSIEGAGSAQFAQMAITDMDVSINGAGSVYAAPTGAVHASIEGAGSVKLMTKPLTLTKNINGFGSVSVVDGVKL